MKKSVWFIIAVFFVLIITESCITKKELTYLQYPGIDKENLPLLQESENSVTPTNYKIRPFDILFIRVITPDPQWSELFNMTPSGGGSITEESASLLGYPVDVNGKIEIPFVGKVKVGGMTLSEIKMELDKVFKNYVKDAAVSVRMVGNTVSIIGEVAAPGRYPLNKERINIFEAISMAGDLTVFSQRQKVQLIRPTEYGPVVKEFSLRDRSILSSEYFYIMPNDIIYVQPMRGKMFQMNSSIFSLMLSSVTTITTLVVFFTTFNTQ